MKNQLPAVPVWLALKHTGGLGVEGIGGEAGIRTPDTGFASVTA
jgi:hypothetical protein